MRELVLVAMGGAMGAGLRYSLSEKIRQSVSEPQFTYGTLAVNVIGCLLAGVLVGLAEKHHAVSAEARLFWLTGILGGFTTLSAFGVETVDLLRGARFGIAAAYVLSTLMGSLLALWLAQMMIPARR